MSIIVKKLMETNPQENDLEELKLFLGRSGKAYLNRWTAMNQTLFNWNWGAFLNGPFWLGYRKMYAEASLIFLFMFLLEWLVSVFGAVVHAKIMLGFTFLLLFSLGVGGDCFYYLHVTHTIARLKRAYSNPEQQKKVIIRQGGASWLGVMYIILLLLIYSAGSIHLNIMKTEQLHQQWRQVEEIKIKMDNTFKDINEKIKVKMVL